VGVGAGKDDLQRVVEEIQAKRKEGLARSREEAECAALPL
jgi:hypothetical protein